MFARLELSIKGEMATLHEDLNQILKRVEGTEEQLDSQVTAMRVKRSDGRITEGTQIHNVQTGRSGKS